jgi:hypothetical protein
MAGPSLPNTSSLSDIMSAVKNIVTALATAAQNYLNVQGAVNAANISAPLVVTTQAGRICSVSVLAGGSASGFIYDGVSLTATTKPLYVIPTSVGTEPYVVNLPVSFGILVVPGSGQIVTISYSINATNTVLT